jgi:HTH-type transcriptional regulator, sugar sensing transcriptional regulator
MEKIIEYLKQLELSELEAKLYLTLLQTGPISVRDLAEDIKVKRTTAYLYIDQLVDKGLVVKLVKGSKKLISAEDPKNLQSLVDEKVKHAKEVEGLLPDIIKTISSKIPQTSEGTEAEIKYYKGKNGVKKIYEEVLKANEVRSYVNIEEIAEVFPENFDLFDNALKVNPDMIMYEVVENSPQAKKRFENTKKRERYYYKFLPEDMKLSAQDILVYDGKVAIISLKDNTHGIVLSNLDLYNNLKILFDFIWKILP